MVGGTGLLSSIAQCFGFSTNFPGSLVLVPSYVVKLCVELGSKPVTPTGDEYLPPHGADRRLSHYPSHYHDGVVHHHHHHQHMSQEFHNTRVPTHRPDFLNVRGNNGTPRCSWHNQNHGNSGEMFQRPPISSSNPFKRNGSENWGCGGNAGNIQMPCHRHVTSGPSNPISKANTTRANYETCHVAQMGNTNGAGNPMTSQMPPGPSNSTHKPNTPQANCGSWGAAGNNVGQMGNSSGVNPMASPMPSGPSNSTPKSNTYQGNFRSWGAAGNNVDSNFGQVGNSNAVNPMTSQMPSGPSNSMPNPNTHQGNYESQGPAGNNVGTYSNQPVQQKVPDPTSHPGNVKQTEASKNGGGKCGNDEPGHGQKGWGIQAAPGWAFCVLQYFHPQTYQPKGKWWTPQRKQ